MKSKNAFFLAVTVAALGYFVDIYDLILFSIVRVQSLRDLGFSGEELTHHGLLLLNLQMAGMLCGGIFFGILGDRRGRLSVLFGSILLYSLANIANGLVNSVEMYAVLRFIAGVGLAGELGAGVTLTAELLPKEKRGYGTTLIASVGVSGALLAWFVAEKLSWRGAFFVGGGLGLALLLLRVGVLESGMFEKVKNKVGIHRGDFMSLITNPGRRVRFLACILMGIQLWFTVGILITLSPEFAQALGITDVVSSGKAVFFCYSGLTLGDLTTGLLSQLWKSRKKVAALFLGLSGAAICGYFLCREITAPAFYAMCFIIGFTSGYWAIFVTVAAEQFGTNLRATVATTVPNFVRGSLVPISALFTLAKSHMGILPAGFAVGMLCVVLSFWGLSRLKESFHSDLDYVEA
jgi:MFS family permease